MERLGKVSEWNDDRGFGFLAPLDGEPALVFFHVRDYRLDGRRPEVSELVKFTAQRQPDGKWRARAVRRTVPVARHAKPAARAAAAPRPASPLAGATAVVLYALFIGWAIRGNRLPVEAIFVALAVSAITFVVYALDKHAAQTGRVAHAGVHAAPARTRRRLARRMDRAAVAAAQVAQARVSRRLLDDGGAARGCAGRVVLDAGVIPIPRSALAWHR